mmetsp:Transcript_50683/g.113905  ORF Transcript_50683/g.113905 Transcript_50683/m.113905 type:complete len:295 (-) Transcript_50683:27-911(-)
MRADNLELLVCDSSHGHDCIAPSDRQTDLHHSTCSPHAPTRALRRRRESRTVERDVGSDTIRCDRHHLRCRLLSCKQAASLAQLAAFARRVHARKGAQLPRLFARRSGSVHGDHPGALRYSNHHRGETKSAAAPDHHNVASTHVASLDDSTEGSGGAAAKCGSSDVGHLGRQLAQVAICAWKRDELRHRPVDCEARLRLGFANRGTPTRALPARAARENERHSHAVTHCEVCGALAELDHDARELMARSERQTVLHNVAIVPTPTVPVATADPGSHDLDNHATRWRRRLWDLLD